MELLNQIDDNSNSGQTSETLENNSLYVFFNCKLELKNTKNDNKT